MRDFVERIKRQDSIIRTSEDLEKEGIVKIKKEKNYFKITGNVENEKFRELKRAYNILSLSELKNEIVRNVSPNLICVFGSYAFGEDIEDSDIDIFVEFEEVPDLFKFIELERYLEALLQVKVDLVRKKAIRKELKEQILTEAIII